MQKFARKAFERVVGELNAAGVPVLAVKGIALAESLYAADERFMVDVDLRVVPEDLPRVERLARDRDWRITRMSKQVGTLEIDLGSSSALVEVESTIGPPGVCAIDVRTMLSRGVRRERGKLHWIEPELHDHALLLCINVFKDKLVLARPWAREDVRRIAELPSFSPATLVERAEEAKLRDLVAVVSVSVAESVPWSRVRALLDDGPRRHVYEKLYVTLMRTRPESRVLAVVARAASDDPRMRARALFWAAIGTTRYHVRHMRHTG